MRCLKEFAQYKTQTERELRLVALSCDRSRSKRIRAQVESRIVIFERNMRLMKSKWGQMMDNMFHTISDIDIYDKITNDLIKSFEDIHDRCVFESDQFDFALRCTIMPISGQLMDEFEDGRKGYIKQERRVYFLMRMLNGNRASFLQQSIENNQSQTSGNPEAIREPQATPSSGGFRKLRLVTSVHAPDLSNESVSSYEGAQDEKLVKFVEPTIITVTILDILFEAVEKHSNQISNDQLFKKRIFHVVNISYVIDVLSLYLDDIIKNFESIGHTGEQGHQYGSKSILGDPVFRYERKLEHCLDVLEKSSPGAYFRRQVDLLLYRVKLIKSKLKR